MYPEAHHEGHHKPPSSPSPAQRRWSRSTGPYERRWISASSYPSTIIPISVKTVVPNNNQSAQPPDNALNPRFPDNPTSPREAADCKAETPERAPDRDEADVKTEAFKRSCAHNSKKIDFFRRLWKTEGDDYWYCGNWYAYCYGEKDK